MRETEKLESGVALTDDLSITCFDPKANLQNGEHGLNKVNNSVTPTDIGGTGFEDNMPVGVTFGSITWSGNMNAGPSGFTVNLKCNNPGRPDVADPEDVTVTVGSGSNTADGQFTVNVGTP